MKPWKRVKRDSQIPSVLGNLLAPQFTFLRKLFQVRDHDGRQLQDNRGRNVGHDPQGKDAESPHGAAGKDIQKSENRAGIACRTAAPEPSWLMPGVGMNRAHAVYGKQAEHEQHALAQVRYAENILNRT